MQPILINRGQFGAQAAIEIFDDSVVALHCGSSRSCGLVRHGPHRQRKMLQIDYNSSKLGVKRLSWARRNRRTGLSRRANLTARREGKITWALQSGWPLPNPPQ